MDKLPYSNIKTTHPKSPVSSSLKRQRMHRKWRELYQFDSVTWLYDWTVCAAFKRMPTYDVSSFVPSWFFGKVTALLHSQHCSLNVFRWLVTSFSVPHYFPLVPVFSHVLAQFEDMIQMFLPKGILAQISLTAKKERKCLPPSLVYLLGFIQITLVCTSETWGFVVKCCN